MRLNTNPSSDANEQKSDDQPPVTDEQKPDDMIAVVFKKNFVTPCQAYSEGQLATITAGLFEMLAAVGAVESIEEDKE